MNYTKPELTTSEQVKALLVATDYSQLPDVNLTEESKAEFTAYRAQLRSLIIIMSATGNELQDCNIPEVVPVPVWNMT
tara:strand:+ start:1565 stop:1798 length:234 start_codon:yes stop_codon:yes gene_type:complete